MSAHRVIRLGFAIVTRDAELFGCCRIEIRSDARDQTNADLEREVRPRPAEHDRQPIAHSD